MLLPDDFHCRDASERALLETTAALAGRCAQRAAAHDRDGSFPHDNVADLREAGYLALTVPREHGGAGAGVFSLVLGQERLARGDGSTALALGWHLYTLGRQAAWPTWPRAARLRVFAEAVQRGGLINSALSEPATGSPSRGGRPATRASRTPQGWVLTGRKAFTTLAPALSHVVVSATADGIERTASLLVPMDAAGVSVDETWDTLGMRATGSHDLVLEGVRLPVDALLDPAPAGDAAGGGPPAEAAGDPTAGWNLHVPAVYLGVARAAADFATRYAVRRRPNSLRGSIAEVPHVQQKLGEMQRLLLPAYQVLFTLARRWDDDPAARPLMGQAIAACKLQVVDSALAVADLAMRVVGGAGLSRRFPLERMFRDVRAGLHNPPMEDAALAGFARHAIEEMGDCGA